MSAQSLRVPLGRLPSDSFLKGLPTVAVLSLPCVLFRTVLFSLLSWRRSCALSIQLRRRFLRRSLLVLQQGVSPSLHSWTRQTRWRSSSRFRQRVQTNFASCHIAAGKAKAVTAIVVFPACEACCLFCASSAMQCTAACVRARIGHAAAAGVRGALRLLGRRCWAQCGQRCSACWPWDKDIVVMPLPVLV